MALAQISRNSVGNKTPRSKTRFRKFPWKSDPFREKIQTSVLDLALGTPQNLEMPLRASEFCDFRCKKVQIIEKIARCAPPRRHQTRPISGMSAPDNVKSEDPAKMTYSIPDFLNRERKRSTAFLEISRLFEGLELDMVSRYLTLSQQNSAP